jgi:hypothetical protein
VRVGRRTLIAAVATVALVAVSASGCRKAGGAESAPVIANSHFRGVSFRYVGDSGKDETINQTLNIANSYQAPVVLRLSFSALDKAHHLLPEVKVSTVFGSDFGNLVAPHGYSYDILRFSGPGEHQVADVHVTVHQVRPASSPPSGAEEVTTQALDSAGRDVSRFTRFSQVRLTNTNDMPAAVRVVYIVWDQPAHGNTQQAVEVTPVGDLTLVLPHGTAIVKLTGAAAAAVARSSDGPAVSIKAFQSQ